MLKKTRKKKRSIGTLATLALLLLLSAVVRLSEHAGQAFARETEDVQAPEMGSANTTPDVIENVLSALSQREARVAEKEAKIALRMAALEEAEIDISLQLQELKNAENALRETLALADNAAENDLARLTSVYENMKSKEAAALFETMDAQFAAGFLGRMKPAAAAGIMAGLSPEAAYAISAVLAGRNASVPKE